MICNISPINKSLYKLAAALDTRRIRSSFKIEVVKENTQYIINSTKEAEAIRLFGETNVRARFAVGRFSMDFIHRKVSRFINEYNDEIEMEIIKYHNSCKVVVSTPHLKPIS